jgi:hypothetical protein
MTGMPSTADDGATRTANRRVVEVFFDPGRPARRLDLFADDGVKEIPFAPRVVDPRAWRGRAELEQNAAQDAGRFAGIEQVDVRILLSAASNELWATSRLAPGATIFGRPYPGVRPLLPPRGRTHQALARVLQLLRSERRDRPGRGGECLTSHPPHV